MCCSGRCYYVWAPNLIMSNSPLPTRNCVSYALWRVIYVLSSGPTYKLTTSRETMYYLDTSSLLTKPKAKGKRQDEIESRHTRSYVFRLNSYYQIIQDAFQGKLVIISSGHSESGWPCAGEWGRYRYSSSILSSWFFF